MIVAIMLLSIVLYSRGCRLLLTLRAARHDIESIAAIDVDELPRLERCRREVEDLLRGQRVVLGAMIAAAPLLGLLGTVSGMEKTFASLGRHAGEKSMEGLAHGISEVLVATESGLTVAIPALLVVYLAHREVHKFGVAVNRLERGAGRSWSEAR